MNKPDATTTFLPEPRLISRRGDFFIGGETLSRIEPAGLRPQGYRLDISPRQITIIAHDAAGEFYARQTLAQLRKAHPDKLPCLVIEDWPDFPARGVMLDISRDKVPTMQTLRGLVDLLSSWKINQIQLYMEHTFAYRGHEEVWKEASPLTADEIVELDEYCRERFIELVPNQNSFGHMERWLKHNRYRGLAETIEGADTPWGFRWKGPFSLCPTDKRSIEFLAGLYDQLLPNFASRLFNVGCDETFDIGQGRSKARAEKIGRTRIYLDFLKQVYKLVSRSGHTMMFWGDIILNEPDLISELPRPIVALDWGYEADHPFAQEAGAFSQSQIPFYVCPGTSSWLSIAGRTDNMAGNQISAAENGRANGAIGFLNTDWGDHGHLQYLPVSYAGFAAGAAMSWCLQSNRNMNLSTVLSDHALPGMGQLACDLGNVYQHVGKLMKNSSALFRILVPSSTHKEPLEGITIENLKRAESEIRRVGTAHHSGLETDEFANASGMLLHACRRGIWKLDPTTYSHAELADELNDILKEHRRLWLMRNRPGGLSDSAARLETILGEYTRS